MYRKTVGVIILGTLLLLLQAAHAAETPDAKVKLTGKALAAGVGYSWGSGVLTSSDQNVATLLLAGQFCCCVALSQPLISKAQRIE